MIPTALIIATALTDPEDIKHCRTWIHREIQGIERITDAIVVTDKPEGDQWKANLILCPSMTEFLTLTDHPGIENASIIVKDTGIDTRGIGGGPAQRKMLALLFPVIAGLMRSMSGYAGKVPGFEEEPLLDKPSGVFYTEGKSWEEISAARDRGYDYIWKNKTRDTGLPYLFNASLATPEELEAHSRVRVHLNLDDEATSLLAELKRVSPLLMEAGFTEPLFTKKYVDFAIDRTRGLCEVESEGRYANGIPVIGPETFLEAKARLAASAPALEADAEASHNESGEPDGYDPNASPFSPTHLPGTLAAAEEPRPQVFDKRPPAEDPPPPGPPPAPDDTAAAPAPKPRAARKAKANA